MLRRGHWIAAVFAVVVVMLAADASQARERRLGEFSKRKTLPFNGYADQVAHLYAGMDLQKYF